jgi:5-methylcytosine-specific restriction endonuclease McrA
MSISLILVVQKNTERVQLKLTIYDLTSHHRINTSMYFIAEFYEQNIYKNVSQGQITDYVLQNVYNIKGEYPRDIQRNIRSFYKLHAFRGIQKITMSGKRDVWCYDPKKPLILPSHNIPRHFSKEVCEKALIRSKLSCEICGIKQSSLIELLEFDHWEPYNDGGKSNKTNCVVLCRNCNVYKKNKNALCFVRRILKNIIELNNMFNNRDDSNLKLLLKNIERMEL